MTGEAAFVPVDQVIALANSLSEDSDHIDRAYYIEWIWLGLKDIGPSDAWYGEATLYPVEYTLQKPKDLYSTIDIALFDASGAEISFAYRGKGSRIHASDNTYINQNMYEPAFGAPVDLSEDQYYYHLGSNSQAVSFALVKYFKFPTDEAGEMLIPESHVLALAIFCKYCYYMRKDDKNGMGIMHNRWIATRNELRAELNTPSMMKGTELARTWNSMIQKARFKKF